MSYYRINWDALNDLPPAERMAALAQINTGIRTVTGAERRRMVDRAVAEHDTQAAAAKHLGISPGRINQIVKENPVTVTIIKCTEPAELYKRYPQQTDPQPAYIALDTRGGRMWADYIAEVGPPFAVPFDVHHGLVRRWEIPALSAEAANRVMEELRPLAERIVTDSEEAWDGSNHVIRMGDDAVAAEEEIERVLGVEPNQEPTIFDPMSDVITVWGIDGAITGDEVEEYGITATTTDERLDEICEEIRTQLADVSDTGTVILDEEVRDHLYQLRDDLAAEAADSTA